jgi:hypothetical protein
MGPELIGSFRGKGDVAITLATTPDHPRFPPPRGRQPGPGARLYAHELEVGDAQEPRGNEFHRGRPDRGKATARLQASLVVFKWSVLPWGERLLEARLGVGEPAVGVGGRLRALGVGSRLLGLGGPLARLSPQGHQASQPRSHVGTVCVGTRPRRRPPTSTSRSPRWGGRCACSCPAHLERAQAPGRPAGAGGAPGGRARARPPWRQPAAAGRG